MKRMQWIFVVLFAALVLSGCSQKQAVEKEVIMYGFDGSEEKELLVENEFLEFHFQPETTQFYIVEKQSGVLWRSNPEEGGEDPGADAVNKQLLESLFSLTYANTAGSTATLNSFAHSVQKGLYEVNPIENGLEVNYTVGNIERVYYIPYAVPESRMREFYDQMEKSSQRKVDEYYRKYDINKLRTGDNKSELLEKYPDLEKECVYELRDTIQPYLKVKLEVMFEEVGYTPEDYEEDMARYEMVSVSEKPVYNLTVRYQLDGKDLVVTVPYDRIAYKQDYPITQLRMLPFFGCGGPEDTGYLLVPDGGGALIHFNNGKNNQNTYTNSCYGWDYAQYRNAVVSDNKAVFPVFGISRNGSSMLCIVEEGSSYLNVEAAVNGMGNSYNNVLAQYAMIHGETMDISSKSDKAVILYEQELPQKEQIVQRYVFCEKDGYPEMAKEYRTYLLSRYDFLKKETKASVPVVVEFIGAVNSTQHRLGLPFDLPLKLTGFQEAEEMVKEIDGLGWQNVKYRLNGWFNDSISHSVPSDIDLISKLGSRKDLQKLVRTVKETGGSDLFLEADFLFMKDNSLFDGFSLNKDAARYVNRERVEHYPYSFIWYGERTEWGKLSYLARPAYMMELIDKFQKQISDYETNAISFRTIGTNLAGDYNEKRLVSREASMRMQTEKLSQLKQEGTGIMIYTGFSYAAPYADFITDLPLVSQGFELLDEDVPFYQIALHGLIPYSGRPVNLAEDYTTNLLRSVEYGAGLSFSFMKEETAVLQETKYREYYANEYGMWIDTANELYQEFNQELKSTYGQFITDHKRLAAQVTMTVYEDGTRVVVNYSKLPFSYEGAIIPARDYLVMKGGN